LVNVGGALDRPFIPGLEFGLQIFFFLQRVCPRRVGILGKWSGEMTAGKEELLEILYPLIPRRWRRSCRS
jgi:hypothetical protein